MSAIHDRYRSIHDDTLFVGNYAVPDAGLLRSRSNAVVVKRTEDIRDSLGSAKNQKRSRKVIFIVTDHGVARICIRGGQLNIENTILINSQLKFIYY